MTPPNKEMGRIYIEMFFCLAIFLFLIFGSLTSTLLVATGKTFIDNEAHSMFDQEKALFLTPLSPIDQDKYTIRINTWKRNEQLIVSLNHHSRCEGVAQIQVIWSDPDNEPPDEIVNHKSGKVVVEKHDINSLNARFHMLIPTPTLGILSLDDDILRSCEALDSGEKQLSDKLLDLLSCLCIIAKENGYNTCILAFTDFCHAGFFRWTRSPYQIVGYDPRLHIESNNPEEWRVSFIYLFISDYMFHLGIVNQKRDPLLHFSL